MEDKTKQSLGGIKRAESLSSDERKRIASDAAKTRWKDLADLPNAEYKGEVVIGDIRIPCAVLEDGRRVLSEHGITTALGSRSGASKRIKKVSESDGAPLPIFLAPGQLKGLISSELMDGPLKEITYKDGQRKVTGYSAEILPTVCDIWLKARELGALQKQQLQRAFKAEILMRGLAHVGIIALVDEATGYQAVRERQALQHILEAFIAKELQPWVKTFPDEFYDHLFRLRGWERNKIGTKKPGVVAFYTVNLIYERLAPGVLEELKKKAPRAENGKRKHKLFQNLTPEIGHPKLKEHISNVLTLQRVSEDWGTFMKMMDKALPKFCDGKQLRLFTRDMGTNGDLVERS